MNNLGLAGNSAKRRFFHDLKLHGRSAPRQDGITAIGFAVLAVFVGMFAFGTIRLTPVYLNYMKVAGVIDGVYEEFDGQNPSRAAIRTSISRRFGVESVSVIDELHDAGFDDSVQHPDDPAVYVACSQCEAFVVNGLAIHEAGCPNDLKPPTGEPNGR